MRETTTTKKQSMKVSIYNGKSESVMVTDFGFHHDSGHRNNEIIVLRVREMFSHIFKTQSGVSNVSRK